MTTIDKLTKTPAPNTVYETVNKLIDAVEQGGGGGGGTATDVQINGTSITSSNVANIVTNSTYNATTNKIATMHDLSGKANDNSVVHLTGDETISGTKTFTYDTKYKIGSSNKYGVIGNSALGFNVSAPSDIDLALGGSNLDFWIGNSGYRLLTGSTGKIPNARINMDSTPTQSSTNAITSGGVYDTLQNALNSKADTDLSNLSSTSSTNFDGQIIKLSNLVSVSLSSTINHVYTIDLSDYITFPDNTYDYEIYGILSISSNNDSRLSLSNSDDVGTGSAMAWLRSGSSSRQDATCFVIPVSSTSRKLYYKTENAAFTSAGLSVWGYRRIGTNT